MLQHHLATQSDVTVAVHDVGAHEIQRFGIVTVAADGVVTNFAEKPQASTSTLASMGIYLFRKQFLIDTLRNGTHENIGRDLMPALIAQTTVQSYNFAGYWADVGTVQAYYEAGMALLSETPALELTDQNWVIHTKSAEMPAAEVSAGAVISNSMICDGARIGGTVHGSIIGPGVVIPAGTTVIDSIILPDVVIAAGCQITRAIIDKSTTVESGVTIGHSGPAAVNSSVPAVLHSGLSLIGMRSVIPAGTTLGANVLVAPRTSGAAWTARTYPDGTAIA
jgi:glucose-1-phosphate adenylyltransferase